VEKLLTVHTEKDYSTLEVVDVLAVLDVQALALAVVGQYVIVPVVVISVIAITVV